MMKDVRYRACITACDRLTMPVICILKMFLMMMIMKRQGDPCEISYWPLLGSRGSYDTDQEMFF